MVHTIPVDRRRLAVGLCCLLALVVAVQLADPFRAAPAEPRADPPASDDPVEALAYAVEQLDVTSHALTVYVYDDGERRRFWHAEVSYGERELSVVVGPEGQAARQYAHADGAWRKQPGGEWRHFGVLDRSNRFRPGIVSDPYELDQVRAGEASVHNRSDDALWLRVDGAAQNAITDPSQPGEAYTLYELDPDSYRLRRSIEYGAESGTVRNVYEFEGYGSTTVERPAGTRNLPVNLLSDLLR